MMTILTTRIGRGWMSVTGLLLGGEAERWPMPIAIRTTMITRTAIRTTLRTLTLGPLPTATTPITRMHIRIAGRIAISGRLLMGTLVPGISTAMRILGHTVILGLLPMGILALGISTAIRILGRITILVPIRMSTAGRIRMSTRMSRFIRIAHIPTTGMEPGRIRMEIADALMRCFTTMSTRTKHFLIWTQTMMTTATTGTVYSIVTNGITTSI